MNEIETGSWVRLTADLKEASKLLGAKEARWLVDTYQSIQKLRIAVGNRIEAASLEGEPASVLNWNLGNLLILEGDITAAIKVFSNSYASGVWLQGICGIGPILAAGILATFDIRTAPTVGHWWRYAGLDPTLRWLSSDDAKKLAKAVVGPQSVEVTWDHIVEAARQVKRRPDSIVKAHWMLKSKANTRKTNKPKEVVDKPPLTKVDDLAKALAVRPFNASAKKLCFLISDQFVRQRNRTNGRFYGSIYEERKAYDQERNNKGLLADQARKGSSRCTDRHIELRARRYVVKMFMSHFHAKFYEEYYGKDAPLPYPFTDHCGGDHRHFVGRPQHSVTKEGLRSLKQLYGEE